MNRFSSRPRKWKYGVPLAELAEKSGLSVSQVKRLSAANSPSIKKLAAKYTPFGRREDDSLEGYVERLENALENMHDLAVKLRDKRDEVFYILDGAVDFLRVIDGQENWVCCENEETLIVPPNALHAFFNKTSLPSRLLSISTHLHQAFFDELARLNRAEPFSQVPAEAMKRVAEIASCHHMHFVPSDREATD